MRKALAFLVLVPLFAGCARSAVSVAEEAAEKMAVTMLFPMIIFIFP